MTKKKIWLIHLKITEKESKNDGKKKIWFQKMQQNKNLIESTNDKEENIISEESKKEIKNLIESKS